MQAASAILLQTSLGYWDYLQGRGLPLPILHAGALAARRHKVLLADLRGAVSPLKALTELMREHQPLLVGLTVMIGPQIMQSIEASRMVKRLNPDTRVVWGGVFASMNPEMAFTEPSVDYVIAGEGEESLLALLDTLADGAGPHGIPGVWHRDSAGRAAWGGTRDLLDLDALPHLPYHLLDRGGPAFGFREGETVALETSRGCPNNCSFCYNGPFCSRRWRARCPERVAEELDILLELYGPRKVFIMDDNFFTNPVRALQIGEEAARRGITWGTHGLTPDMAIRLDTHYLKRLAGTGCNELKVGVEHISAPMMKVMNKRFSPPAFLDFNRRLARFDIGIQFSFILGFPGENLEDIEANIGFALKLLQDNPRAGLFMINTLFPYPGTEIHNTYTDASWRRSWDLKRYGSFEINCSGGPWLSRERQELLQRINLASMFISRKSVASGRLLAAPMELLRRLYLPVARRRLERLWFSPAPELRLSNFLLELLSRFLR